MNVPFTHLVTPNFHPVPPSGPSPPSLFTDSAGTAKPEPYLITGMASERQLPQLPPNSMYGFDMADMTNMDTLPLGNCLLVFAWGNLKRWATTEECLQPWKKFEKKNMTRHLAISKSRVGFSAARLHSHLPPESQQFGWCRFLSDRCNGRQQIVHHESDALKFVEQCHKPPIFWWFTSMYGKIGELGMVYYSSTNVTHRPSGLPGLQHWGCLVVEHDKIHCRKYSIYVVFSGLGFKNFRVFGFYKTYSKFRREKNVLSKKCIKKTFKNASKNASKKHQKMRPKTF